ncbi:MAG TPA: endonuclease domain-containing protein [Caulobacteraceae bacterium]|jgi:very-short-patch-repair endonuclease
MARPNLKPSTHFARDLRERSTDAEWKLWAIVRNRQLGGFKFRRQVLIDRYFADFACREARLVVEIDGSQHQERIEYDAQRSATLESCGWRVIRFDNGEVLTNPVGVGDTILLEIQSARR